MVIAAVASGDYTGTPDPHTLNGGALLSVVVASVYGLFPGLAWWLWVLEFLLIGSLTAVVFAFFIATRCGYLKKRNPFLFGLLSAIGVFGLFAVTWVLTPTWTVVAFAPGMAAILIATTLTISASTTRSIAPWLLVGALAALVGLVRSGPFSFIAFIAASALLWAVVFGRVSWPQRIAIGAPPIVLLAINFIFDSRLYGSEPWQTGRRLFEQTHILVDTYLLGALTPIGLSQGWRGYEIGFASARYFVPSDAFTVASFDSFIEAANPYRIGLWAITPPSAETLNNVVNATRAGWSVAVVGLAAAFVVLAYLKQASKTRVALLLLSAAIGVAVILFLGFIRNNPGHVALPLGFVSAISSLSLVGLLITTKPRVGKATTGASVWLAGAVGIGVVLVTSFAMNPYQITRFASELESKQRGWLTYEATFEALMPGCPVFGVNVGFELATARTATPAKDYPIVQVMWNSLTPLTDQRLKLLGFEKWDDLFAEGACTYFMGGGDYANAMTEYARDRGGVGEFVRIEVPVEGAPEIYQWQSP
jgi:MFS family permease